jgi:HSP20 family molecular chaperone IbpA
MFKNKYCKNCKEKIKSKDKFCPNCGFNLNQKTKEEGYGILGKNDFQEENLKLNQISNAMFSGFGGKIMGKMLNNAMKMLEKEMEKGLNEPNKKNLQNREPPMTNFELFINGKRVNPENIRITKQPMNFQQKSSKIKNPENQNIFFSKENTKKYSEYEKEEPKTNLKRIEDKVIYEISIPGVNSIKDISIVKLENSIEVKAISKNKAYVKRIPLTLNISGYNLFEGKLILELKE